MQFNLWDWDKISSGRAKDKASGRGDHAWAAYVGTCTMYAKEPSLVSPGRGPGRAWFGLGEHGRGVDWGERRSLEQPGWSVVSVIQQRDIWC